MSQPKQPKTSDVEAAMKAAFEAANAARILDAYLEHIDLTVPHDDEPAQLKRSFADFLRHLPWQPPRGTPYLRGLIWIIYSQGYMDGFGVGGLMTSDVPDDVAEWKATYTWLQRMMREALATDGAEDQ